MVCGRKITNRIRDSMFKLKSNNIKIMCIDGTYLHRMDQIKYLGLIPNVSQW